LLQVIVEVVGKGIVIVEQQYFHRAMADISGAASWKWGLKVVYCSMPSASSGG
jgi:hypothetical protein